MKPSTSRSRFLVPAALLGAVGIFGLVAFGSGAAAGTAKTTTTSTTPASGTTTTSSSTTTTTSVPSKTPVTMPGTDGIGSVVFPASYVSAGEGLYESTCASCHGVALQNPPHAPNLLGVGAATVDFWVSTGRMPLAASNIQATMKPRRFDEKQTEEIAAYVASFAPVSPSSPPIPAVNLAGADVAEGFSLFTLNCASCHTVTGSGDALADGTYAPSLHTPDATQVAEAIRTGPGNMPRFGQGNLTDAQVRDIDAYVTEYIQHPANRGGIGFGGIGPVAEGFVGLLVGVGSLALICFWIGDRS